MTEEELAALVSAMDGQPGDLLFFAADHNKIVWQQNGSDHLTTQTVENPQPKGKQIHLDHRD